MNAHPIDTEALRRLADAATEGPWEADHSEEDNSSIKEGGREWWDGLAFAGRQLDAEFIAASRTAVPALLDLLAAAEHRATRAEAQSAIRGRAVVIYRDRAREAEARIKAVQELIDQADTAGDWTVTCSRLQWAIDGTIPRETFTWHCDHCPVTETLDDLDDAYRAARLHTITVHGVHDHAPTIERQETR